MKYLIAFVIANVCCYVLGQFDDYTLDSQHNGVGRRVSTQHRTSKRGNGAAAASAAGLMGPSDLDYNYQQENTFYDDINMNYYQEGVDLLPNENKIRLQRHHIHDYEPQSHQHVCLTKPKRIVHLNWDDSEWEYLPSSYQTVECLHPFDLSRGIDHGQRAMSACGRSGYDCLNRNRTVFVTRRHKLSPNRNCWKLHAIENVSVGCDCMSNKLERGDIGYMH